MPLADVNCMIARLLESFSHSDLVGRHAHLLKGDSLVSFLIDCGYVTFQAENGEKGLALLKSNKPDLLMLDLNMPGMSGMDVLTEIKEAFLTGVVNEN